RNREIQPQEARAQTCRKSGQIREPRNHGVGCEIGNRHRAGCDNRVTSQGQPCRGTGIGRRLKLDVQRTKIRGRERGADNDFQLRPKAADALISPKVRRFGTDDDAAGASGLGAGRYADPEAEHVDGVDRGNRNSETSHNRLIVVERDEGQGRVESHLSVLSWLSPLLNLTKPSPHYLSIDPKS